MTIRIYNTLGGKKEEFIPIEPGKVKMYVCGPTVYDSCHIGHARSVVVFDVIARYFENRGIDVTYVRNFTDVDDKIINKANETGIDSLEVAEKYINEFYEDMDALNVRRATHEPRVTGYMEQIIDFVDKLIGEDMAYEIEGDVYYSVDKFDGYGKLSGRNLEEMEAGSRIDVDKRKQNPFDFALWKSAKPGEPAWKSPWGHGRPGWHIECSTMSSSLLGDTFDIHGGGKDLIFPHHENEIAQSEGANKKTYARYWVHNGFITINQEKMSKSLGNFLMIKDILKSCHPEAVRLFLLASHYRSPIDFSDKAISESGTGLDKIYTTLERIGNIPGISSDVSDKNERDEPGEPGKHWQKFVEAMNDDFNTAKGIGILFDAVRSVNRTLDKNKDEISASLKQEIETERDDILKIGDILGILSLSAQDYFKQKKNIGLQQTKINPEEIEELIRQRTEARKAKDWKTADDVRQKLQDMNVVLEDRADGTVWKIDN